jgi:plastocyanin
MRSLSVVRALLLSGLLALTACSSDTTAPSGSTTIVSIQNFYFYPFTIAVRVGATVQWTNYDPVSHTTTSDLGLWDSGAVSPVAAGGGAAGGSFRFTFMTPGTYGYHCSIHPPSLYPGFVGIVVVRP